MNKQSELINGLVVVFLICASIVMMVVIFFKLSFSNVLKKTPTESTVIDESPGLDKPNTSINELVLWKPPERIDDNSSVEINDQTQIIVSDGSTLEPETITMIRSKLAADDYSADCGHNCHPSEDYAIFVNRKWRIAMIVRMSDGSSGGDFFWSDDSDILMLREDAVLMEIFWKDPTTSIEEEIKRRFLSGKSEACVVDKFDFGSDSLLGGWRILFDEEHQDYQDVCLECLSNQEAFREQGILCNYGDGSVSRNKESCYLNGIASPIDGLLSRNYLDCGDHIGSKSGFYNRGGTSFYYSPDQALDRYVYINIAGRYLGSVDLLLSSLFFY